MIHNLTAGYFDRNGRRRGSRSTCRIVGALLAELGGTDAGGVNSLGGWKVRVEDGCVILPWLGGTTNRMAEEFAIRLQRETDWAAFRNDRVLFSLFSFLPSVRIKTKAGQSPGRWVSFTQPIAGRPALEARCNRSTCPTASAASTSSMRSADSPSPKCSLGVGRRLIAAAADGAGGPPPAAALTVTRGPDGVAVRRCPLEPEASPTRPCLCGPVVEAVTGAVLWDTTTTSTRPSLSRSPTARPRPSRGT